MKYYLNSTPFTMPELIVNYALIHCTPITNESIDKAADVVGQQYGVHISLSSRLKAKAILIRMGYTFG